MSLIQDLNDEAKKGQKRRRKKCEDHDDKKKITMDDIQVLPFKLNFLKGMETINTKQDEEGGDSDDELLDSQDDF